MYKFYLTSFVLVLTFLFTRCNDVSSSKKIKDSLQAQSTDSVYFDSLKADFYFDTAVVLGQNGNLELSNKYFSYAMRAHYKNIAEVFYYRSNNFFDIKDYYGADFGYTQAIHWSTKKESKYYRNRALARNYLGYDRKLICNDVDSAILLGDTTDLSELCTEADRKAKSK